MVKIYTIVKDEIDIVKDWIVYHGCTFGWHNLYIIDNLSTDGTWEAINEFRDLGIHLYRESDYSKKGFYMGKLIREFSCNPNDPIAFPIDIDEFIVYYDHRTKTIDLNKKMIQDYIQHLPESRVYKANYIVPYISKKEGYHRAPAEADYGYYYDLGNRAKSFIHTKYFRGEIDHGNHIECDDYLSTNIHLIHYHHRNVQQYKKKIKNNLLGLGYPIDLSFLKNLLATNRMCQGNHHVSNAISILENTFEFPYDKNEINIHDAISLTPLKKKILGEYS
jgi:hypothetical protein